MSFYATVLLSANLSVALIFSPQRHRHPQEMDSRLRENDEEG